MEEHELCVVQVVGLNAWGVQMVSSGHSRQNTTHRKLP